MEEFSMKEIDEVVFLWREKKKAWALTDSL